GRRALTKQTGTVCVWTVGIHPSKEHSVAILPFHPGPRSRLGEPLLTDYFQTDAIDVSRSPKGHVYDDYWAVKGRYALIKANGSIQTKLEMPPRRTLGRMASVNLESGALTAVEFQAYPELDYLAPFWRPVGGDPFRGSVLSVFVLPKWF